MDAVKKPSLSANTTRQKKWIEPQPGSIGIWDHASVASAISAQTTGTWQRSALLGYIMLGDGRFGALVDKLINGLIRITPTVRPVNEDNQEEANAAKLLQDNWQKMVPEVALVQLLRHFLLVRCAPAVNIWKYTSSMWMPVLQNYSPHNTSYTHSYLLQGVTPWRQRTYDGLKEITPGDGRWVLMTDWTPGVPLGFASQLGMTWLDKQIARANRSDIANQIANQKYKAITPMGETDMAVREQYVTDIMNIASTAVVECPQNPDGSGYNVEAIEVNRDGWETASEAISEANNDYAIAILGANLTTEISSVGSYAAAEVHAGVAKEIIQSLAAILATTLRDQIWKPFIEENVGIGVECPWVEWLIPLSPEEEKAAAAAVVVNEDRVDQEAK